MRYYEALENENRCPAYDQNVVSSAHDIQVKGSFCSDLTNLLYVL
jgi:hypothetical protein